jgi:hypothetical protein
METDPFIQTFVVGIRNDGIRYVYVVDATSEDDALEKAEHEGKIKRDPYGRNWVQKVEQDVHFIASYPIPDPYVG